MALERLWLAYTEGSAKGWGTFPTHTLLALLRCQRQLRETFFSHTAALFRCQRQHRCMWKKRTSRFRRWPACPATVQGGGWVAYAFCSFGVPSRIYARANTIESFLLDRIQAPCGSWIHSSCFMALFIWQNRCVDLRVCIKISVDMFVDIGQYTGVNSSVFNARFRS